MTLSLVTNAIPIPGILYSFRIAATADWSSSIFAGAEGFDSREHAALARIAKTAAMAFARLKINCRLLLLMLRECKFCFTSETRSISLR
jgi:hypothetical protein